MRFLAGRRTQLLSYVVVGALAATTVFYAVRSDGFAKHRADLNDGVIWVSNDEAAMFGRFNKPISELDGITRVDTAPEPQYDVVQLGAAVLGIDRSATTVYGIDVATGTVADGSSASIDANSSIVLNGGTLGVVDSSSGKVWTTAASEVDGIASLGDVSSDNKPVATVGKDAGATVTADGTLVAASNGEDSMITIAVKDGRAGKPAQSALALSGTPQLTAVGNQVVVLDSGTGQITVDGEPLATVTKGSVLQQAGPAAGSVLVETPTDLLDLDLSTGEARSLATGAGTPAAPVRVGPCAYGAWSGMPTGSTATVCADGVPRGGAVKPAADLVLRANRGEVVLNDRNSGAIWNIDDLQPQQVDNWDGFKPTEKDENDNKDEQVDDPDAANRPPKASPDQLGARPGVTTVLHVLDNDQSPEGTLLAIASVTDPSDPNASARISPDAQSVLLTLSEQTASGNVRFSYTVNAGSDKSATASVSVPVAGPDTHHAPRLRENAAKQRPDYTVPSGGAMEIAAIGDWRDPIEGDAVSLTAATATIGTAHVTADGRVRFEAPQEGGTARISYTVTDSDGETSDDEMRVTVQKPTAYTAVPPKAQPDLASGVVGEPILIRPLDNDVAGSDPLHPDAQLVVSAPVPGAPGLRIQTDLNTGKVTAIASRAGSYTLKYQAGFGDAATSTAPIRIDVRQPKGEDEPITVPDAVTLYDTGAGVVDVLANDFDPRGRLLIVQDVKVIGPAQPLQVSVVDGHWVRLRATDALFRNPVTIRYTVSNGDADGVPGDLVVRQAPRVEDDEPVTVDDYATVRAGSAVAVPVLDNDFTPSGGPVSLAQGAGAAPTAEPASTGTAFVSGRLIRFVAPATVESAETVDVTYLATNADGVQHPGVAHVTITPLPSDTNPNQVPTPPTVDARVVAGDTVSIKIPAVGVDPDGDPVTVTGLGSAPALGRITKFGATELRYQAFPSTFGTDSFEYRVTDIYGGVAFGTVRVAVAQPARAQASVAVDDTVTAAPGRRVTVPVMVNDYVDLSDNVQIEDLETTNGKALPAGTKLVSPQGPIEVVTGPDDGRPVTVTYTLTNGRDAPSTATLRVRSQEGFNNAPVVYDAYGTVTGESGDSVSVDVLKRAYDPDGKPKDLKVVAVTTPPKVRAARISGGKVTLQMTAFPQVVPYEVADADGARSTAFIYVPATGAGPPYLRSDKQLKLPQDGNLDVDINDWVVDPAGKPLSLTLKRTITAAPAGKIDVTATDDHTLRLVATDPDYVGPGSITFQVTNAASISDEAAKAMVTIPVQVGDPTPVMRCPSEPIDLIEGGAAVTVDIPSLCHVWTADPADTSDLSFHGEVASGLDGVEVSDNDDGTISLRATGGARPTTQPGKVTVSVDGADARGALAVTISKAGPPTLNPVRLDGVKAGETRQIDLTSNFYSPLGDATPRVLSVIQQGGGKADESASGTTVSITPQESGRMTWQVVMTDVSGAPSQERQVSSTISMEVLDVPDAPGRPSSAKVEDGKVSLHWDPAAPNGAPVNGHTVTWAGGSQSCGAAPTCVIRNLTNGQSYAFAVTARNPVGESEPSPASMPITPDAVPGRVGSIVTVGEPRDHLVKISWAAPEKQTSVDGYLVSWTGHRVPVSGTTAQLNLADNNAVYEVTVVAKNQKFGFGPTRTISVQSSGRPATPGVVSTLADGADGKAKITVTWSHDDWQGKSGSYEVYRNGARVADGLKTHEFTDDVAYDGRNYTYAVKAINATGGVTHTSRSGTADPIQAQGVPDTPTWQLSEATGENTTGQFSFSAGELRGTGGTYKLSTNAGTYTGDITRNGSVIRLVKPAGENGSDVTPSLVVCNAQNLCSSPSNGQSLRPYGPLSDASISNVGSDASGTTVSFHATIDTNGRPATVTVTGNRGFNQSWNIDSRGQQISGSQDVGYSTNQTFTIRVSDGGRGSGQKDTTSPQTANPPPPNPTIDVGPGSHHTVPGCTSAGCKYVKTTTHNFSGTVTCRITGSSLGTNGFITWTQGPNATREGPNVQNGGWVDVQCSDGSKTASARGYM